MLSGAATIFFVLLAASTRDPMNIEFAEALVGAHLRDSGSARYLDVHYVGDRMICGSVNARNGHGGYVGYVPFAAYAQPSVDKLEPIVASSHKGLFSEVLIGYDERMRDAVSALCREN